MLKSLLFKNNQAASREFSTLEIRLLQIFTASIFIGRGWQHLFWDVPFRELLWDEHLMTPVIQFFGSTWNTYISNLQITYWLDFSVQIIGVFYLFLGGAVFAVAPNRLWIKNLIWISSFFLFCLTLLYWKEHFYRIGQLIEYTLQWATPILLIIAVYHTKNNVKLRFWIKITVALTFMGHGLYALGYYPIPGSFIQMILDVFALNNSEAATFLMLIGILDFVVTLGLFLPKVWQFSVWYCILWGFATAFARIIANFDLNMPLESLHQWFYETIYRLPHGGIPLLLWFLMRDEQQTQ